MCVAIGNFMPSLDPMDDKDIFTNITGLGILVITVIGNVCIQLGICSIRTQILVEHVVFNVLCLLLFVISTFSTVTIAAAKKYL